MERTSSLTRQIHANVITAGKVTKFSLLSPFADTPTPLRAIHGSRGPTEYVTVISNVNTNPNYAAVADFLGTGQAGLIWENASTGEHSFWVMQGGSLSSVISLPTIPIQWHIAGAADFLGTGQADLVWENTITGERSIWIMRNAVPAHTITLPVVPIQWQITER